MVKKKIIVIISLLLSIFPSIQAQTYNDNIGLGVGWLYERGLDATVSYEHETKYHNAWEYFINGYVKYDKQYPNVERGESFEPHYTKESVWNGYRTWGLGVAYKPCVSRGRNHHGNMRIGASVGSNTDVFLAGIHVGYEHSYALTHGWKLFWQVKCDCMIPNRKDLFRTGAVVGIKLPTQKR